jgi:sarcosine oxidase
MTTNYYDFIVAGVGSMGAATCSYLAAKGCKVLGLEQFDQVPHENGSHTGQSRIIRKAYFEHPDYIPLLQKAYLNWHKLQQVTGEQVYFKTGLLYCGPANHKVIKAVKEASVNFNIALDNAEGLPCLSAFSRNDDTEVILEHDAGFLLPEKCISLYIKQAIKNGAVINTGEKVIEWSRSKGMISVQTNKCTYSAHKLIITAGAWADKLINKPVLPLKVTRQVVIWV